MTQSSKRLIIIDGLRKFLADTYTLYLTTHNFHWNVTGVHFASLHELFMAQYTELWTAVDVIAERIRALGSSAPGSYREFARLTTLPDAPEEPPEAHDMVRLLAEGHEKAASTAMGIIPDAEEAGDHVSTDLLVSRIAVHEKAAWMLRSMISS